jgi:hypothetical protein
MPFPPRISSTVIAWPIQIQISDLFPAGGEATLICAAEGNYSVEWFIPH